MAVKLARVLACFEQAGLIVIEKEAYDSLVEAIDRQAEEIEALELRIKRLLDTSHRPIAPPKPPMSGVKCI